MALWDIKDRTFLITGGASGLGAGYAESFLNHGAKVSLVYLDTGSDLEHSMLEWGSLCALYIMAKHRKRPNILYFCTGESDDLDDYDS